MKFAQIWKAIVLSIVVIIMVFVVAGCENYKDSSDGKQMSQQEKLLIEAWKQCGMPNIVNFREKKLYKQIYELRDQTGLLTYSYVYCQFTGKFVFLGETLGYPIPCATQYTASEKLAYTEGTYDSPVVPQADPNGLFSPSSAAGTWIMLLNHKTKEARPAYFEPDVVCRQDKFGDSMVQNPKMNQNPD